MATLTNDKIYRLAKGNPKVIDGVKAILNEHLIFNSFERALNLLVNAKNDYYLRAVEAGLQMTINDVLNMNATQSPYMDRSKTAFYLYTLQNLIFNLADWQFASGKPNQYHPQLVQKFQHVLARGAELGVEPDVIKRECYTDQFQDPQDPVLCHFEFLDEHRLDTLAPRLKRYQLTQNPHAFYEYGAVETVTANNVSANRNTPQAAPYVTILDKIIALIKKEWEVAELDLALLTQNCNAFLLQVEHLLGTRDHQSVQRVAQAVMDRITGQTAASANPKPMGTEPETTGTARPGNQAPANPGKER